MRLVDFSFDSPADNLALEEAILNAVERDESEDTIRFWESTSPFVVLGVGQVLREEVNEAACARDAVPVLRRCTAGGCVVQGPGCLNFSLFLRYDRFPEVRQLRPSYCYILKGVVEALQSLGVSAQIEGVSDLAVSGMKISGNAQKRRKFAILHHGTVLYSMDPALMERYLLEPTTRPEYRGTRSHLEFVRPVALDPFALRGAIGHVLHAPSTAVLPAKSELDECAALSRTKYSQREWTYRR